MINDLIEKDLKINELQNKIDKAIEYINKKLLPYGDDWHWDDAGIRYYVEKLLEILGDKENE